MPILVVNGGSSSLKFALYERGTADPRQLLEGEIAGIGTGSATLEIRARGGTGLGLRKTPVKAASPVTAIRQALEHLTAAHMPPLEAIGHRVVHPGPKLHGHQLLTRSVFRDLEAATAFAPLHDPEALTIIREAMFRFPQVPQYACFDTEFHRTMPPEAFTYPIPANLRNHGVRRYGFHGLSCESAVHHLRSTEAGIPRRLAIAHLGSGASVTALLNGNSVDTTMGLTPTGGVVMGTRPGDLDPGLVLYLLRQHKGDAAKTLTAIESLLNHNSGLVGLSGMSNDFKSIRVAAGKHEPRAMLAVQIFTRSIAKALGSFCFLLGGLDAIVFTGGIGENDPATRAEILGGLQPLGIALDQRRNKEASHEPRTISVPASPTRVLVVPADEDRMIAIHVDALLTSGN